MQQPQKQLTLFQTGFKVGNNAHLQPSTSGSAAPQPGTNSASSSSVAAQGTPVASGPSHSLPSTTVTSEEVILIEDDEDDLLLAQALDESMRDQAAAAPPPASTPLETLPGFDVAAGSAWVYPVNFPIRQYQFSTVQTVLYHNTLVSLPTGLGKTFIAAVVMYNFYRWYPLGKVVFMAPTKPLVAQQIDACYRVMGIPRGHTAEVTGHMSPTDRRAVWQAKRVFFLTPQVLSNDLTTGSCPAHLVRCVVVDEAHKALGNHAYCQVIRELSRHTSQFRVLALSATPGSNLKAIVQVLTNLLISRVEARSEESADIMPYTHQRQLEKTVVPLSGELKRVRDLYMQVLATFARRLIQQKVVYARDETTLTKFQLLRARDAFKAAPPPGTAGRQAGLTEGDFAICMSLYHALELLLQHGIRSFYSFLQSIMNGEKGSHRGRAELARHPVFSDLMAELAEKFDPPPTDASTGAQPGCQQHGEISICYCDGDLCNGAGLVSPGLLLLAPAALLAILRA